MRHFILPVDDGIGMIRQTLEKHGLAEDTIVWFFSDNGAARGNWTNSENTRGSKGSMSEGGQRVPAGVWGPGRIPAGTVSDELILTCDLMPTHLELAGVKAPDGHLFDGINVSDALFKGAKLPPMMRYWNMGNAGAMRDGSWKLVVKNGNCKLYNLANDHKEAEDLAAEHPERVQSMRSQYESWLSEVRADSPYASMSKR